MISRSPRERKRGSNFRVWREENLGWGKRDAVSLYLHGAYMRQSVERALHNAGYGIPVQVPVKITFSGIVYCILRCIYIYIHIHSGMNTVLWAGIKVSTHRVLRFVSPVNILLWTSLSLFSDNNLRNEGSLLNRGEYKYDYEILKRKESWSWSC